MAAAVMLVGSAAITLRPIPGHCNVTTLVSREILADIIEAFRINFPLINRMGIEFRPTSLKLGKQYTAHIPSVPTVEDVSTTYATTGNNARSLLTDVDLTVNNHQAAHLYWEHFALIGDDKARYQEVIDLAGYALAKAYIDDLLSGVTTANFTHQKTYAAADFDLDALIDLAGTGNTQQMNPVGRCLIVSTDYANYLSLDSRITNRNDGNSANREVQGNALRRWANVGGFTEIIEYPDMPTNNGTALTSVTAEADDDLLTKAAHGLETGDPFIITFASGFTGLTTATKYYAIKASSSTFKAATTRANAEAGTAINITADGTGATVTKTENLGAFAFDRRAFVSLAGPPESADPAIAASLGIPISMAVESITSNGITMGAAKWQDTGTGKLHWAPTLLWGKALGRQGSANAANSITDRAGIRIITA
jgi:hypothetical protein